VPLNVNVTKVFSFVLRLKIQRQIIRFRFSFILYKYCEKRDKVLTNRIKYCEHLSPQSLISIKGVKFIKAG